MKQRESTLNEYKKQINKMIEYITNHLDEDITLSELADLSGFSPYHFHRIVRAFLGESLGSYMVRMKMETAAKLLRYTELSVSEIAYRVGYDVPGSLTKAFRQLYGIPPLEYRNNKDFYIVKPMIMNETINLKAHKVLELPTRRIMYIKLFGSYGELDYAGAWQRLWKQVKEKKIFSAGIEHIAIYHADPQVTEGDKLQTDICLTISRDVKPDGEIGVKELQGGRYAMFLYTGCYEHMEAVYNYIYSQKLPESGLSLRDSPVFEKYVSNPEKVAPEKLKTEIYIPIE